MTIEFECPHCGLVIEAPDRAAGRKANCPECGGAVKVPKSSRPSKRSSRPPVEGRRRSSGRRERPDEYSDERPSRRRRRPDDYEDLGEEEALYSDEDKTRYLIIGGIAAAALLLIVILIVAMRNSGPSPGPAEPEATAGIAASLSPTPTPLPSPAAAVNAEAVAAALAEIASAPLNIRQALIESNAEALFGAGKDSLKAMLEVGIESKDSDVRIIADYILSALTNRESQMLSLFELDESKVEEGRKAWREWWNEAKDRPLEDIIRPAVDSSNSNRAVLATALGYFRDKGTVPFLFDLLEDADMEVRSRAYESVKRLLKNDRFGYDPNASLPLITEAVRKYREWWDSVKAAYDFEHPEKFLPPAPE